ncbi:MAG: sigma-E factor negative regulatory protein [Steroidobacteraceae bacterium]|nr:sigma-E factor negative regulatory protein [Steroidobacteraceae bacterium]
MTDRIKEQLSTFLDGELPEAETALLLKRLERDDELRGALSRYSLIGAVLRSDGDVPAARQVAARVSAAIAHEPVQGGIGGRRPLARTAAGLGIAASVAAAAVMLAPAPGTQVASEPPAIVAQLAEVPALPVAGDVAKDDADLTYTTPPASETAGGLPPAELANYLVAHYGYASPLLRRSVVAGLIAEPGAPGSPDAAAAADAAAGP